MLFTTADNRQFNTIALSAVAKFAFERIIAKIDIIYSKAILIPYTNVSKIPVDLVYLTEQIKRGPKIYMLGLKGICIPGFKSITAFINLDNLTYLYVKGFKIKLPADTFSRYKIAKDLQL